MRCGSPSRWLRRACSACVVHCGSARSLPGPSIALVLTPSVTSAVALAAVEAVTREQIGIEIPGSALGCLRTENYAALAQLPPGLVATDIDYGPFVLALTPHSVMSAPYHRLVAPIIAAHQIFALPPAAAQEVVADRKPDYLVICGRHALGGIDEAERAASLWGRLAGRRSPGLARAGRRDADGPLMIYRVKR